MKADMMERRKQKKLIFKEKETANMLQMSSSFLHL